MGRCCERVAKELLQRSDGEGDERRGGVVRR
jgi:hypothetical protein